MFCLMEWFPYKKSCNIFKAEGSGENKAMENAFCFQKKNNWIGVEYNVKHLLW